MSADPRRLAAVQALVDVDRGRDLEAVLERRLAGLADLQAEREVHELVRGVLQWRARYDHLIAHFSRRDATGDRRVRTVLRLALHELLTHERTPAYATIHQAGELLRSVRKARMVGYANAVLQAVRRHLEGAGDDPLSAVWPLFAAPGDLVGERARWWSMPEWLVARWTGRLGPEDTEALLAHTSGLPPVTLHVLPGADRDRVRGELAAVDLTTAPHPAHPRALVVEGRPDRRTLGAVLADRRDLLVQDAGAQGVVDWLTDDGRDLEDADAPVIDLCAAPGGKTAHLHALLGPDRLLVAMDLPAARLGRLRENRLRLALDGVTIVRADGLAPPFRQGSCDAVLLDGPCSGTGVLRHHPEGRWRLEPEMLETSGARLGRLARAAADLLRPGGRLYYATCSLEPEENETVVEAVLEGRPELEPAPADDGRWHRYWWPWRTGTDGFFAARLRRRRS